MRLKPAALKTLCLIMLAVGLSGCTRAADSMAGVQARLSGTHDRFGPNWGGTRPTMPTESLTVQRVRGVSEPQPPLRPEPGDVWPGAESPRATLANPEDALRGEASRGITLNDPFAPPRRPRGSSSAFEQAPGAAPAVISPIFEAPTPPPRANRTDGAPSSGQVFQSQQGPVTTTGGSGRVNTTISPQGSGLAIRDGATTTLIGPGGNVQQVPTPR